jgi:hypothetical protein
VCQRNAYYYPPYSNSSTAWTFQSATVSIKSPRRFQPAPWGLPPRNTSAPTNKKACGCEITRKFLTLA